ncbi:MAG: YicC/YloC family endoribonuclease, partial [Longimicrobiales bacterium]|nr:YicC/YloC family endoribonuclease [Longimicrobiales bacterium]
MIRSMTGFGEVERAVSAGLLRVSIKTVNHRFLNVSVRTPPGFDRLEHEVTGWLRPFLQRGHATVNVTLERGDDADADDLPRVDLSRASHYAAQLREMREALGLEGEVDVATVARFPEVMRVPERRGRGTEVAPEELQAAVEAAARTTATLREAEG